MKTKEFIEKIKDMGYAVSSDESEIRIFKSFMDNNIGTYANISEEYSYGIDTQYSEFDGLSEAERHELFHICFLYASTPLRERADEKKYYLRHKWLEDPDINYLNFKYNTDTYYLESESENKLVKTQFTLEEIDVIKRKFNTDLKEFEIMEVKE